MKARPFLPGLSAVHSKSLTAARDGGNLTSNAGVVVLREVANRLGLADVIAGPLVDTRNPAFVTHSYADMVAPARTFGFLKTFPISGPGSWPRVDLMRMPWFWMRRVC